MTPQFVDWSRWWSADQRNDSRRAAREAEAGRVLDRAFGPDGTGGRARYWWLGS